MKRSLSALLFFLMIFSAFDLVAEQKKAKPNPPYAVSRGFSNLMFGWLEIPRGIIYENSRIPVVGFVTGPLKGTLLTAWRALAGSVDIVAMGLTREGLYCNQLPDFVWDAQWISPCGEDIVKVETLNTSPCLTEPSSHKKKRREKKTAKKRKRGFSPGNIKSPCSSSKSACFQTEPRKYKTTVLCWKSPKKSADKKLGSNQSNNKSPVPFNIDSDDEFLEAIEQIKHHVSNIEHQAQMISSGE